MGVAYPREADFRDAAMIAVTSFASQRSGMPNAVGASIRSTISSSQSCVSSASSSTVPSLEINSAFDRPLQAAR